MTLAEAIAQYVQMRDTIKATEERHKAELAPMKTVLGALEGFFLESMNAMGVQNISSTSGTVYKTVESSVRVADWGVVLPWIVKHEKWDMLERRIAKTAYMEHLETGQAPVPGVDMFRQATVRIRRS